MKITRRGFEFTVEQSQVLVVPQLNKDSRWCAGCARDARMVSPEFAAMTMETTERELYRLIEAGQIHFSETRAGEVLVCMDSLSQRSR